uniref:Uncharacterized protein n=1 Tax=Opuntia streptacantha TaxID=393608 RepID=A0A7C9D999_OPUST
MGEDLLNGFSSLDRDSGLLNNDLVRFRNISNHPCSAFPVGQVSCFPGPKALGFGGSVDRHKHNISFSDILLYIGAEEEVPPSALLHHILKARLVDGQLVTVPRIDPWN